MANDFYTSLLKQRQGQPSMEEEMVKQYNEQLALRQQALGDAKGALVEKESQQLDPLQQVNIQPLMAATDSWFGGNMSQGYKAPQAAEKKEHEIQRLKNAISQQEGGLIDDRFNVTRLMMEERRAQEKNMYNEQQADIDRALKREMLKEKLMANADLAANKNASKVAKGADDKEQKILKTKQAQTIEAQINLKKAIDQYEGLVDKHGINLAGANKDAMNSAYADLKIKYKEAAKLGALTGPDVGIIVDAIAPATGVAGAGRIAAHKMGFGGGTEGLKKGIGQIKQNLESDYKTNQSALEAGYGANSSVLQGYRANFYGRPQASTSSEKMVKIRDPQRGGKVFEISESDLESAVKDGAELVP
jgi:hypothetical protein